MMDIDSFLSDLQRWASGQPGIGAMALVGSHARGQARSDSDIDIVLMLRDPASFLSNTSWVQAMGEPLRLETRELGRVTSLRVWYAAGEEVEYVLVGQDWAEVPSDEGDWRVISAGIRVLYEAGIGLSQRVEQFREYWT